MASCSQRGFPEMKPEPLGSSSRIRMISACNQATGNMLQSASGQDAIGLWTHEFFLGFPAMLELNITASSAECS